MGRKEAAEESPLICYSIPLQPRAPCSLADSLPGWTSSEAPSKRRRPWPGHLGTPELPPPEKEGKPIALPFVFSGPRLAPEVYPDDGRGRAPPPNLVFPAAWDELRPESPV